MSEEDKVICPVCNQVITDFEEGISDPCEHVMVSYVDMLNGELVHVGENAKAVEQEIMTKYNYSYENDLDESIDELLKAFASDHDGYEVLELTTYGMSCGPCSSTEYHLIKLK